MEYVLLLFGNPTAFCHTYEEAEGIMNSYLKYHSNLKKSDFEIFKNFDINGRIKY